MNKQRFAQIKETQSFLDRESIENGIVDLNLELISNNANIISTIERYVEEFISSENFSIDYIKGLLIKLYIYKGIEIQTDISVSKMLFNLIFNTVLLPNYLTENTEQNYLELKKIIDDYLIIFDIGINKLNQENYCLELGNPTKIVMESIENDEKGISLLDYRTFNVGEGFGNNLFMYDETIGNYAFKIAIDLDSKVNKYKRKLKPKRINGTIKNLKEEYITKLRNKKFIISTDIKNDSNTIFGDNPDGNFFILSLSKPDIIENPGDIISFLTDLINFNNFIINELSKEFGLKIDKHINIFASGEILNIRLQKGEINSQTQEREKIGFSQDDILTKKLKLSQNNKVYLKDVGGQKEAKTQIELIIDMIKREQLFKSYGARLTKGIILQGPSGTGKTLLAKVIATEIDAEVYNIKLTDIQSSNFINVGANNVSELFSFLRQEAKKTTKKIIVILDELDALFKKRSGSIGSSGEDIKIVNTFLSEMDGFDSVENIIFVGTTNSIESIDEAVIRSGRMENKIKVGLPNLEDLKEIYKIHIGKLPKLGSKLFEEITIDDISKKSIGLTGANIEDIVNRLITKKVTDSKESKNVENITLKDFDEILEKIKGTPKKGPGFLA